MGISLTGAVLLNSSMTKQSTVATEESTLNYTLSMQDEVDNIGSLYYVVAVIFIYGFSIVFMIASHIRKNQQDNQLRTYLKEMALLRKKDRREKILNKMSTITTNMYLNNNSGGANSGNCGMDGPTSSLNTATNNIPQFNQATHHCCLANISNCTEHNFNDVSGLGVGPTPSVSSMASFNTNINKTLPLTASNDYNNTFPDENGCYAAQNILQMKPMTGAILAFTDGHLSNPKRIDEASEMIPLQANLSYLKSQQQVTMPTNRCLETIISINDTSKRHIPKNDKKPLVHIDIINEEVIT